MAGKGKGAITAANKQLEKNIVKNVTKAVVKAEKKAEKKVVRKVAKVVRSSSAGKQVPVKIVHPKAKMSTKKLGDVNLQRILQSQQQSRNTKGGITNVLQGPDGYKKAITEPGKHCVLPPLGSATGTDAAIPLALNNSLYLDRAWHMDTNTQTELDSKHNYLVLTLCPVSTMFGIRTQTGTVRSGLGVMQMDNLTHQFNINDFLAPNFPVPIDLGMISVFGTDCTSIGQGGNVFSMAVDVSIQTADANQGHECFIGTMPIGSLLDEEGGVLTADWRVLLQGAIKQKATGNYRMRNFIRNPATLVEYHRNKDQLNYGTVAQEMVTYMIIVKPSRIVSIGNLVNTSSPYSLGITLGSNWIVWPKADPASKSLSLCTTETVKFNAYKSNHLPLKNTLGAKWTHSGNGFLGDAWDFLKSIDMEDVGWLASRVLPLLADPLEVVLIQPDQIIYNVDKIRRWINGYEMVDPQYSELFQRLKATVEEIYTTFYAMSPYMYPEVQYDSPKTVVGTTAHKTWELLQRATNIPVVNYAPGIGFYLSDNTEKSRKWFNEFEVLYDEINGGFAKLE